METAFFRFYNDASTKLKTLGTALISLLVTTIVFGSLAYVFICDIDGLNVIIPDGIITCKANGASYKKICMDEDCASPECYYACMEGSPFLHTTVTKTFQEIRVESSDVTEF
jgi:hypothetical protein